MCVKVAWVWPPASYPKSFWLEEKRDGMQYTIEEIAKEHDVLLLAPVGMDPMRIGWKFFYRSSIKALLALKEFDPDVINLNCFGAGINREIVTEFPNALITLYDHGGNLTSPNSEHVDVFFTAQEYRRELVAQRSRVPIEKVFFNPHGYDPKRFYPDDSVEKTYTGIMVGDFRRFKGQDMIIHNWKDVEGKLLLIGRTCAPLGDSVYVGELRSLAERLGLSDRVEIQDFVPHDELPRIINSAEIGIHMSTSESGSRAITEMMACGLPMIVMNRCRANVDWVKDGGLAVEHGINGMAPNSIGSTVRLLKKDPAMYQKLREAALRTIKPYTYDRMLTTFKKVIEGAHA